MVISVSKRSPRVTSEKWSLLTLCKQLMWCHYNDVIMTMMASQITSLTIVYKTVYSDADQRKHQSSASLAFVWGIHRGPVNSPHKWPVTRKMFPVDDVIMCDKQCHFWHNNFVTVPQLGPPDLQTLCPKQCDDASDLLADYNTHFKFTQCHHFLSKGLRQYYNALVRNRAFFHRQLHVPNK